MYDQQAKLLVNLTPSDLMLYSKVGLIAEFYAVYSKHHVECCDMKKKELLASTFYIKGYLESVYSSEDDMEVF